VVEYRCRESTCRTWYEKRLGACPECGTEPHAPNSWLRTAGLNGHLYKTVESGNKEAYGGAYRAAKELLT